MVTMYSLESLFFDGRCHFVLLLYSYAMSYGEVSRARVVRMPPQSYNSLEIHYTILTS